MNCSYFKEGEEIGINFCKPPGIPELRVYYFDESNYCRTENYVNRPVYKDQAKESDEQRQT